MANGKATETVFSGTGHVIAFADVCFIELVFDNQRKPYGISVVMKQTRWDSDRGDWANACYLSEPEAALFKASWCIYRHEIDQPADIRPDAA